MSIANKVVSRIYEALEKQERRADQYLGRLGASSIGDPCIRKVWLSWRGFYIPKFSGRTLRIFKTGHLQETRIIDDLRLSGLSVWDADADGNQFEFTDPLSGHFIAKVDGVVKALPEDPDTPHMMEVKTHSDKSFKDLTKHGVLKSKPMHWYQMQSGMLYGGFNRGLYVALNKNDEQFYVETVEPCEETQMRVQKRVANLVRTTIAPSRIADSSDSFACKFCDAKEVCWNEAPAERNCRTCTNCSPGAEGTWVCNMLGETRSFDGQRAGCEHHVGFL
jgi:hypothetical protein